MLGPARQDRVHARQHAVGALEQHDPRGGGVDVAEVAGDGARGDLLERSGQLHARRAGAHHDEGQLGAPGRRVGFLLGLLEGQQDAPPDLQGVIDGLQARGAGSSHSSWPK